MRAVLAAVLAILLLPAAAHAERYGTSARDRPLTVERVGDPAAPTAVLVIGSIHGNESGRARRHRAAPRGRAARGCPAPARPHREPGRGRRRHAPERARRRPQPQLPARLARRRAGVRHVLPRPPARVRARDARAPAARPARAALTHALLPPGAHARRPARRRRPVPGPRLRAPRRPARAAAGPAAGDGHRLAEHDAAGLHRVRGRAPVRAALRPLRDASRPCRARPRVDPRAGGADAAEAADRVGPDPVRERPRAADARATPPVTTATARRS